MPVWRPIGSVRFDRRVDANLVEEIAEFAAAYRRDVVRFDDPPKRGGSPHYSAQDGRLLDAMEDLFLSGDPGVYRTVGSVTRMNVKAAARAVSEFLLDGSDEGEKLLEAQVHRLARLWKRETEGTVDNLQVRTNYRIRGSSLIKLQREVERNRSD